MNKNDDETDQGGFMPNCWNTPKSWQRALSLRELDERWEISFLEIKNSGYIIFIGNQICIDVFFRNIRKTFKYIINI